MNTQNKTRTTLLSLLIIAMTLTGQAKSYWWTGVFRTCNSTYSCMFRADLVYGYYGHNISPYEKFKLSRMLSSYAHHTMISIGITHLPLLWYGTLPLPSMKRNKPWPWWDHPHVHYYRFLEGEDLEKNSGKSLENNKKIQELFSGTKNEHKEAVANCQSIKECINQVCKSVKAELSVQKLCPKTVVSFYQSYMKAKYFLKTGKNYPIDYFKLSCFPEHFEKLDNKVDNLPFEDRIKQDIEEEEVIQEFYSEYSSLSISGFEQLVLVDISQPEGKNVEEEHGQAESEHHHTSAEEIHSPEDINSLEDYAILDQVF